MLRDRFTSNYNTDPESRLGRILTIIQEEIDTVTETLERVRNWRSIDNAKGAVLDAIGANYDQPRGAMSDEIYRVLIRSKIARGRSTGTYDSLISVLALALQAPFSNIVIEEGEQGDPQIVRVMSIPIAQVLESGITLEQFSQLILQVVAAGVGVDFIQFTGTFEYVEDLETDLDLGFADFVVTFGFGSAPYGSSPYGGDFEIVGGGTYGFIFDPSTSPPLPI